MSPDIDEALLAHLPVEAETAHRGKRRRMEKHSRRYVRRLHAWLQVMLSPGFAESRQILRRPTAPMNVKNLWDRKRRWIRSELR